jgi:hypothetical protein
LVERGKARAGHSKIAEAQYIPNVLERRTARDFMITIESKAPRGGVERWPSARRFAKRPKQND